MSLEDFDPLKTGGALGAFGAAAAFVLWLLTKAKALFKNGDADEIKGLLHAQNDAFKEHRQETKDGFDKVSGEIVTLRERMVKVETIQEWDGKSDRRGERVERNPKVFGR